MFFTLGFAPFHMVARGLKIWAIAELDAVRLGLKKLLGTGAAGRAGGEVAPRH